MILVGLALLLIGALTFAIGFFLNSSTPMQVGPIPTFGGAFMALVGLILFLSHI